jgi:hypothetical protein
MPCQKIRLQILKNKPKVASGDSLGNWLHTIVIQGIEADIDLYFGPSGSIKEKLYNKIKEK